MRLPEKQQLIIIAAAIAVGGWFVFGQYLPNERAISELKAAKLERTIINNQAASGANNIPLFRERLKTLQEEIGNYGSQITDGPELGKFLQQIAEVMNECGLGEQMIQPGKEYPAGELVCIPIDIKCKGSLKQIFNFFKEIEQFSRVMQIQKVELLNDSKLNGEIALAAEVNIFYQPADKDKI